MKSIIRMLSIILLSSLYACSSQVVDDKQTDAGSYESFSGPVTNVIRVEDQGYSYVAYEVEWNDKKIIVEDSILERNLQVGDELNFLVMWHELETEDGPRKLLGFAVL